MTSAHALEAFKLAKVVALGVVEKGAALYIFPDEETINDKLR